MAYLDEKTYYSKVYGCWMGKNVGGTLGAPLEEGFGRPEMFDVWWYPVLREGGIPNDDLEIQLIWLQMLEDRGLDVTARDFADYWLDCIVYNPDEYGLHKVNLRMGLLPPISGWYNNWFKHCMGSPIRSEIWACIAPGQPNIAAAYAYQDAILDHAGGESVYGEIFNAALESAAFFESDRDTLLDIGLSFIPEDCLTARAIRAAIEAPGLGMDWKQAREHVLKVAYHYNAQFSPVNLGFQTIGWIYGEGFGDSLCKAVNCGYDTDCTGATLGSILGIIGGLESLPEKWTEPLSDKLATSLENGGIKDVRVPENLDDLTRKTMAIGRKLLALNDATAPDFTPSEATKALWTLSPTEVPFDLHSVRVRVEYAGAPVATPGEDKALAIEVKSRRLDPLEATLTVTLPEGFRAEPECNTATIGPGHTEFFPLAVRIDEPALLQTTNRGSIRLSFKGQPQVEEVPIVLIGANRWLVSPRFDGTLDTATPIEADLNPQRPDGWTTAAFPDNAVDIEPLFGGEPGILYLRHYVYNPAERPVRAGFPSNVPFRMWLNGQEIREALEAFKCRPNLWGEDRSYADVTLPEGWSQFLIKVQRFDEPVEAHFTLATQAPWFHGLWDVTQCRFPWD